MASFGSSFFLVVISAVVYLVNLTIIAMATRDPHRQRKVSSGPVFCNQKYKSGVSDQAAPPPPGQAGGGHHALLAPVLHKLDAQNLWKCFMCFVFCQINLRIECSSLLKLQSKHCPVLLQENWQGQIIKCHLK